ncbi:MAG: protein kinase, partial [Planctomycetaceae bacterium]|nr:protein kinase [Planctomycetaceae bacterium]
MSDEPIVIAEYELINCVATGTASQIWEVRQKGNPESLAMKLLLAEALADPEQKKVLKHEARVHQSLEHPNFLKFHKVEVSRDHGFILMEYFRAPNLKNLLYMDALAVHVRMRKLLEGLCLALQSMHDKGWVHRDIKPDNILFNKSSELKLIDFSLSARAAGGLAKIMGGKMRSIQGTRTYIAPETIRKKPATPQTDMYSLGVTLYEVLTGRPPFMGSSPNELLRKHLAVVPPLPSEFNTNVSQEFSRIIMRLLAKKPADRYKTMNEAYAEMRSVKPFKIEAQELADQKAAEKEEARLAELQEMHDKLDSRADFQRSVELGTGPKKVSVPAKVEPEAPKPPEQKPAAPQPVTASAGGPSAPAASQPGGMPPGGFPPGYAPQPGQQLPPGMQPPYPAQPGQPPWGWPGGMPPQGAPWPGGMPPGQGAAMPPQQWPPGYYPQNPQ